MHFAGILYFAFREAFRALLKSCCFSVCPQMVYSLLRLMKKVPGHPRGASLFQSWRLVGLNKEADTGMQSYHCLQIKHYTMDAHLQVK